jgi:predicted  nucleic acid-binding Zn-ribbon protein
VVNADPAVQLRLLDLQAADAKLAQLGHRRRTLPELTRITDAAARAAALHSDAVELRTEISDIATEQRRMENDIEVVRARESRDQARLDSGGVPAKELEGLQHELASLQRRQGTLEDAALEVMERREELESALADVMARAEKVADGRLTRSAWRLPRRSRPTCSPSMTRCARLRVGWVPQPFGRVDARGAGSNWPAAS